MTHSHQSFPLADGIAVIHSNQLEELRDVVAYWLRQHPLAPLENEVFLVQSNGMGQWLKQHLAQNDALGIAAAIKMQLPASFIWTAYRAVLAQQIPEQQLLAKAPLTWRLYRLLPALITEPDFATLASFLSDDNNSRKRYQLAERLADLFDQYQVYRPDWISDWSTGRAVLRDAQGKESSLPVSQQWQAALWQAIVKDLGETGATFASRALVHGRFMAHIDTLDARPSSLPRRIILFGLSSLPQQMLEVLEKLGKFCQIVFFVHNPCQHYWADIIEGKELLKAERRRQRNKPDTKAPSNPEELHLQAPPLLAAWGKQGRDYIRLLDQFDNPSTYADWHWPENKTDLFKDYGEPGQRSLLQRLQQSILDLEPLPGKPELVPATDDSIAFHIAHSAQREVEILHDQLLARFSAAQHEDIPLAPRDCVVMVPDIDKYAPAIRAVFGQIQADDPRYLPFSLSDQQQRGQTPLLVAVEFLLDLPASRFAVSELLDLLEVPALRARFSLDESAVPKLHRWIEEAGIRWGLNAGQRAQCVAMPKHLEANTWQFGLRRMLLGYAVGAGLAFDSIEPYEEIGGLEAQWLGSLSLLLETLEKYALSLSREHNAAQWRQILSDLLDDFFVAGNERERKTLDTLSHCLTAWEQYCEQAGLTSADTLPVNVVREAWLGSVDEPSLHQRFLGGRINFCTLMPMRAIPFRLICLLGMNDGDYPRNQQAPSFDLMSEGGQYRPGDRSRRQDDHYLFLEALLSARRQLYISWVGRSIRDNSVRPPSVLISQLRDVLAQGWAVADLPILEALTVEHPLQPFSQTYITKNRDPRLFTFAREWFATAPVAAASGLPVAWQAEERHYALALETLARFLRAPVKTFCNQTLKYRFDDDAVTSEDCEPFAFDPLQSYLFSEDLLQGLRHENSNPAAHDAHLSDVDSFFSRQQQAMMQKGLLPLSGFAQASFDTLTAPVKAAWEQYQSLLSAWPIESEPAIIQLPAFDVSFDISVSLTGALSPLRRSSDGSAEALIYLSARSLVNNKTIQYHKLLSHWLRHLAACAAKPVVTLVVCADDIIEIPPIEQAEAHEYLATLVGAFHRGIAKPLPVASKSAFAWLNAAPEQALEKARSAYEGDDWNAGEVDYDAYLTRFFPSFANLMQNHEGKNFEYWADALYRPVCGF
ncbi:MAG: exodeoxyribonuclease V subunit gamma [Gammaproteobacteria bacterium HGW-Gammaproteobacteria-3]|nr:MAG: exodeoxyribonuclease V subunit gamma [Gammaproteobacteria bacterium HGW-Gammaproteobacteria-3]